MTTEDAIKYFESYLEFCRNEEMGLPSDEPFLIAISALREKEHNDELRKNGRLVELPCAVNDILYTLVSTESGGIIRKAQVREIKLEHRPFGDSVFMVEQVGRRGLLFKYYESDFGKSVFYTQEEAETELTNREEQCDGN